MTKKTEYLKKISSFSKEELNNELLKYSKQSYSLRIKRGLGSVKQVHLFKEARKNIARIKTLLSSDKY